MGLVRTGESHKTPWGKGDTPINHAIGCSIAKKKTTHPSTTPQNRTHRGRLIALFCSCFAGGGGVEMVCYATVPPGPTAPTWRRASSIISAISSLSANVITGLSVSPEGTRGQQDTPHHCEPPPPPTPTLPLVVLGLSYYLGPLHRLETPPSFSDTPQYFGPPVLFVGNSRFILGPLPLF